MPDVTPITRTVTLMGGAVKMDLTMPADMEIGRLRLDLVQKSQKEPSPAGGNVIHKGRVSLEVVHDSLVRDDDD